MVEDRAEPEVEVRAPAGLPVDGDPPPEFWPAGGLVPVVVAGRPGAVAGGDAATVVFVVALFFFGGRVVSEVGGTVRGGRVVAGRVKGEPNPKARVDSTRADLVLWLRP
jgi:hypothetical protein